MSFFTWKDNGLTSDCSSLDAMASRFEETANLMKKLAKKGFLNPALNVPAPDLLHGDDGPSRDRTPRHHPAAPGVGGREDRPETTHPVRLRRPEPRDG